MLTMRTKKKAIRILPSCLLLMAFLLLPGHCRCC